MTATNGFLFILLSQIIWGITPVIIKFVPQTFPSSLLVASRFIIASVMLFAIILFNKKYIKGLRKLSQKTILQIIVLGVLGSGLADFLMTLAIRNIGVILAIMIARLEIPLGVILAGILLKEKITRRIIVATILSFLGVIFVSYGDNISIVHNQIFYLGIGFALSAAILWAFTGIIAKKILTKNTPSLVLTFGRFLVGGIFIVTLSKLTLGQFTPYFQGLTVINWSLIVFLGVVSSAVAYFFYYKGLDLIHVNKASIMGSISIMIAVLTGLLIGETLSLFQWVGTVAIIIGIYLVITEKSKIVDIQSLPINPEE